MSSVHSRTQIDSAQKVSLTINGSEVCVDRGSTLLQAAWKLGVYIPVLCSHPDLPPASWVENEARIVFQGKDRAVRHESTQKFAGCGLCAVQVEDELLPACSTRVEQGMEIRTENERIKKYRQGRLSGILCHHPHACLVCAQHEGCSQTHCPFNIPEVERCCQLFGRCELQRVARYVGIPPSIPQEKSGHISSIRDNSLILRDYRLCVGCTRCVRVCREVRGVGALDFVIDEQGCVQVGSVAPDLEESGCTMCTACVQVCPTGALQDGGSVRLFHERDIVPCRNICPAGIDVPRYLGLAAEKRMDAASAVIREKTPFPATLGRVCDHPCEQVCRRGDLDAPVHIRDIKRCVADQEGSWGGEQIQISENTGKKVAIVGSGPAGLTAAYFLRLYGHAVGVYEAKMKPGGMLRHGITSFRLPKEVLEKEIHKILNLGVELYTGHHVGSEISPAELLREYAALFFACGASLGNVAELPEPLAGKVVTGIDFLSDVNEGALCTIKGTVAIIGGGNVALDVGRTALRLGAERVFTIFPESTEDMPAAEEHVQAAQMEGVEFYPSTMVVGGQTNKNRTEILLICRETKWQSEAGKGDRPSIDDSDRRLTCNHLIAAAGQYADMRILKQHGLTLMDEKRSSGDAFWQTNDPRIFVGGDMGTGSTSVAAATASGRRAAGAIHRFLVGDQPKEVSFLPGAQRVLKGCAPAREAFFLPRDDPHSLMSDKRTDSFAEVWQGLSSDQAVEQASRCLHCDCRALLQSNPSPPKPAVQPLESDHVQAVPRKAGVFQLFDTNMDVLTISGCTDLFSGLSQALVSSGATWFSYEESEMYSQRENELLQKYIQEHGHMPFGSGDDLDELFDELIE